MEGFLASYPQPHYVQSAEPANPRLLFSLMRRRKPGENGKKWTLVGQISMHQCRVIAETSPNVEEMRERIRLIFEEGRDTTKYSGPSVTDEKGRLYTDDQVKDLVKQAVIEYQKQLAAKGAETPDAEDITEDVVSPPIERSGIQMRQRKSAKEYAEERNQKVTMWAERAKILGIQEPIIRARDNHIDGRWLRRAEGLWAKHVESTKTS